MLVLTYSSLFRVGFLCSFQEYFDREMAAVDAEVERWVKDTVLWGDAVATTATASALRRAGKACSSARLIVPFCFVNETKNTK